MALTDVFVAQYLLQETEAVVNPISWRELDSGGFETEMNGVQIRLEESHTRTGALLFLTMISGHYRIAITEPQNTAVFGRKYKDDDQRRLAELLRKLESTVQEQCARRRQFEAAHAGRIREAILQKVVFGSEVRI